MADLGTDQEEDNDIINPQIETKSFQVVYDTTWKHKVEPYDGYTEGLICGKKFYSVQDYVSNTLHFSIEATPNPPYPQSYSILGAVSTLTSIYPGQQMLDNYSISFNRALEPIVVNTPSITVTTTIINQALPVKTYTDMDILLKFTSVGGYDNDTNYTIQLLDNLNQVYYSGNIDYIKENEKSVICPNGSAITKLNQLLNLKARIFFTGLGPASLDLDASFILHFPK